jgi:hypothetical protein
MYLTGWGVDACLPCSSSLSLGNYTGKCLYKNSSANFLCAAVYFKSLLRILECRLFTQYIFNGEEIYIAQIKF